MRGPNLSSRPPLKRPQSARSGHLDNRCACFGGYALGTIGQRLRDCARVLHEDLRHPTDRAYTDLRAGSWRGNRDTRTVKSTAATVKIWSPSDAYPVKLFPLVPYLVEYPRFPFMAHFMLWTQLYRIMTVERKGKRQL
jgi:hypothetical protein